MKQFIKKLVSLFCKKQNVSLTQRENPSDSDVYNALYAIIQNQGRCERHDFEVMRLTNITDTIDYLLRESLIEEVDEVCYRITECGRAKYDDLHFELTGNLR